MKYATKQNTKVGDVVLIPIEGEWMHDEQIMVEHEVVMAFKCLVKPEDQIVGSGHKPLPLLAEFHDDIAYRKLGQ